MKRRSTVVFLTAVIMLFAILATTFPAHAQAVKKYHLKYGTPHPPPPALMAQDHKWFMDEITKRTNGQVTFEYFWGGSLFRVMESLDAPRKRIVDIASCSAGAFPEKAPLSSFEYAFPFGPSDPEIVIKAYLKLMDEFPQFQKQMADNNQIILEPQLWDDYNLLSKTPVKTIEDLKNKVIGMWGIYFPDQLAAAGATGMPGPMPDRYLLIKLGTINASLGPIDTMDTYKLYEVAKYMTYNNAGAVVPGYLTMNLDAWRELTPDLQKLFMKVGREAGLVHAIRIKENRERILKFLKGQGVSIFQLPDAEKKKWLKKMPDIPAAAIKSLEAKGYPAHAIFKRWMQLTKELGHNWLYEPTWY